MSKFADWYNGLSPTQHLMLQVVATLTIATLSAFAHQRIGYRRGYKQGAIDAQNPVSQAQLEAENARGHRKGYLAGVWANEDAIMAKQMYTQGILDGSQAWMDAGLRTQDIIRQASQTSASLSGA
jgi:hypothetical protein